MKVESSLTENPAPSLFNEPPPEPAVPLAPPEGPFAGVAIEQSIDRVLDYSIPKKFQARLAVGQRVRVPLGRGNYTTFGYVVRITGTTEHPRVKPINDIDDDRVLVRPAMMELARWISRYYMAPMGMVLEGIIPSAVKKRIGLGYTNQVRAAKSQAELQAILEASKSAKRRSVIARLLQVEEGKTIELHHLALEAKSTPQLIKKLATAGLITITEQVDLGTLDATADEIPPTLTEGLTGDVAAPVSDPLVVGHQLNDEQAAAVEAIRGRLDTGFSSNLLYGVTGSGKTEVYLQCIKTVVEAGKQAIVLVPEIALTPQTVRRFVARFPRVAVLHSALSNTERHQSWQRISTGRAQVIVGARSAIFAPTKNLGLIVVDEEHEPSYKQDGLPRYHARDVAIKRAQLEKIPVLLGTATPSLETWHNVQRAARQAEAPMKIVDESGTSATPPKPAPSQNFHLLRLNNRVRGLALPKVELIDLKEVNKMRKGIHLFSPRLEKCLQETLDAGEQAILLLNRRGYANCIFCTACNEAVQCKYCDATMTYHRTSALQPEALTTEASAHVGQMHCHYCLAVNPLPTHCPTCAKKLSLFGLGTQRVEEELKRKFPGLSYARADSDTMRSRGDYEKLLGAFGRNEISVMLGTQMIAKGLDYPNVTLVGVISGDTALALPDFRAAERTFQLITQVAGRAGRGDRPGRVIVQSFLGDDPALSAALNHDFEGFAKQEMENRLLAHLPPFARMVRIVLRDQSLEDLHQRGDELAGALQKAITDKAAPVEMRGPMPCAIERIANYHRAQIVLDSPKAAALQAVLNVLRTNRGFVSNDRVAIDVDPVSML